MGGTFLRADVRQKQGCLGKTGADLRQRCMLGERGGCSPKAGNRRFLKPAVGSVCSDLERLMLPGVYSPAHVWKGGEVSQY